MQALRDDPTCADEEQAGRVRADDPGLSAHLTFDLNEDVTAPHPRRGGARPRVAILREQGSTARSRWRPPSIAPASTRSTST